MTDVKCEVDNCMYFKNNICTADQIEVSKNITGGVDIEAGVMGNKKVNSNTSDQTKCVTFKPNK